MKHHNTRTLYVYWNTLRGQRSAPYRNELDPRAISAQLESTFILECNKNAAPRFRLAGTRLCDQFGMELRGMSALSLWHGEGRTQIRDLLNGVIARPAVGHAACTVETRSGYLFEAEFLFLPLYNDLGVLNRILGCGYYIGSNDLSVSGHTPIHHWVDSITLSPIEEGDLSAEQPNINSPMTAFGRRKRDMDSRTAPISEKPLPIFGTEPLKGKISIQDFNLSNSEKSQPTNLSFFNQSKQRGKKSQPMLYAIDGGLQDSNTASRLLSARARTEKNAAQATHLRLVKESE